MKGWGSRDEGMRGGIRVVDGRMEDVGLVSSWRNRGSRDSEWESRLMRALMFAEPPVVPVFKQEREKRREGKWTVQVCFNTFVQKWDVFETWSLFPNLVIKLYYFWSGALGLGLICSFQSRDLGMMVHVHRGGVFLIARDRLASQHWTLVGPLQHKALGTWLDECFPSWAAAPSFQTGTNMTARLETFFSYITKIVHRNVFLKTFYARNKPRSLHFGSTTVSLKVSRELSEAASLVGRCDLHKVA